MVLHAATYPAQFSIAELLLAAGQELTKTFVTITDEQPYGTALLAWDVQANNCNMVRWLYWLSSAVKWLATQMQWWQSAGSTRLPPSAAGSTLMPKSYAT
jgi:hypothetical protein